MYRLHLLSAALCVLLSGVDAVLEQLQYAVPVDGEDGNCPGMAFSCGSPGVCAQDPILDKYYCCIPGAGGVCWTGATGCSGEGDNEPGGGQLRCSSGDNAFCCLDKREECTQTTGQVNICWSTQQNPVLGISSDESQQLYSSLRQANPEATALPLDSLDGDSPSSPPTSKPTGNPPKDSDTAEKEDSTDSGASASDFPNASNPSAQPTSTDSTGSSNNLSNSGNNSESPGSNDSSSGLSGGTIAGIVVGAVVGITLIGLGAFFLVRRNKKRRDAIPEMTANSYMDNTSYGRQGYTGDTGQSYYGGSGKWAHTDTHEAEATHRPVELDATGERAELEYRGTN